MTPLRSGFRELWWRSVLPISSHHLETTSEPKGSTDLEKTVIGRSAASRYLKRQYRRSGLRCLPARSDRPAVDATSRNRAGCQQVLTEVRQDRFFRTPLDPEPAKSCLRSRPLQLQAYDQLHQHLGQRLVGPSNTASISSAVINAVNHLSSSSWDASRNCSSRRLGTFPNFCFAC